MDYPDKYFTEKQVLAVDSNFFEVFQFPFIAGNPAKSLHDPNSIVLTEEMAQKYFGRSDVLGELISYGDEKIPYRIAGILKNIPRQSSLKFDFLVPMQSYPQIKRFNWSWVYLQVYTYVKVSQVIANDPVAIAHIEAQNS
jgi:putative ABC transport system permease protein